jgi:ribosome-associated toxin RatA of RatAB toxin-antitoxin module
MHVESEVLIRADVRAVYDLAAHVERWPKLLPHYRWVRILEGDGERRLVEMAARRDFIPVRWWAVQERFPDVPRITFRHVRGPTRGMEVEWSFEQHTDGVRVRIRHDLHLPWPIIGELVADRVIGRFFVSNIAGKTLRRVKAIAEASPS